MQLFAALATAAALAAALVGVPRAQQTERGGPVFAVIHRGGVALNGYDAVAYLRAGEARRGLPIFEVEHGGYLWHFESDLNAGHFRDDPGKYVPAYGGYAAMGVAEGYLTEGDPEVWSVRDGRVYLFFSHSLRQRWLQNTAENIRSANRNWIRFTNP